MTYERQRATALRIITQKGQPITVRFISETGSDWANLSGSQDELETVGVFFPITRSQYETARLRGSDIKGSVYVMVPGMPTIPKPGDQVKRGSEWLTVEFADVLAVNDEVIYHELYLNGAVSRSLQAGAF